MFLIFGGSMLSSVCIFMYNASISYRSQQAFMQSGLSQPSPVVLSGTALHNFPAVQHQELAKAQSSLAFQQTSNTQPIPILYEHQLSQASGLGGSQLIDTHILQVGNAPEGKTCFDTDNAIINQVLLSLT